jgi:RimJ/RimL family protein N-acetyltransferase
MAVRLYDQADASDMLGWARVVPGNVAAAACYRAAGFVRAAPVEEATLNVDQERVYVWMRYTDETPG